MKSSPFDLTDEVSYQAWRKHKLAQYPKATEQLIVEVDDIARLTNSELQSVTAVLRKTNSVIYRSHKPIKGTEDVRALGQQLGLNRLDGNLCADDDGISGIQVRERGSRHEGYIPYTNRAINWHTDGYYNTAGERIRAMILHCVSDAQSGGENTILDPEIAYILMREADPEMVRVFSLEDVMTIPANMENGVMVRPAETGPVFSVENETGNLHMRYTARTRSIEWKQDSTVQKACDYLRDLLSGDSEYVFHYRLQPGEGIVSNNALHNRTAFTDAPEGGKQRLIYRARYYDRVANTNLNDIDMIGETRCCG